MTIQGTTLLRIARGTIEMAFGGPTIERPDDAWLEEHRAVFVTLNKSGALRGCVGQLAPRFSLFEAVRQAAQSAAFHDTRFSPVSREEVALLHIEISVLSVLEELTVRSEADVLQQLRPGIDGVVLTHSARSGVFIPEVWKQLPEPQTFLSHLKRKAGLPQGWLEGTRVERFTAEVWSE